ncbi:MAG TPA: hypothetical protein VNE39_20125 [Planctomycetota bacterium]|nr:hypothetical protein [Planctomycetota bacterium]
MSNDVAVDPQEAVEAGLPDEWREHVRELRGENARRRKENQELRAQLAALEARSREAAAAQAAANECAQRETARLATVHRRLKEVELARLTREALAEAATRGAETPRPQGRQLDPIRVQRLLALVPAPVELDADLVVTDEGQVVLSPEATERLKGYAAEMAELASVEARAVPHAPAPPVGGEPPRASSPSAASVPNAWEPEGQTSPLGRARAAQRRAAAQPRALDALARV